MEGFLNKNDVISENSENCVISVMGYWEIVTQIMTNIIKYWKILKIA